MYEFNFDGMKRIEHFIENGYKFKSYSGNVKIKSYIAKKNNNMIYGFYDYQKGIYVECILW